MVKLLENTFRAVNIGLVNEIALMCHRMDIDVWEVIDAAKTKPFGFMPFYPGPGLGGHCIPIDPVLPVVEGAAERFRVPLHRAGRARQLRRCRSYVVERVADALNSAKKAINGSRVHLFGVAYKKDVGDVRESPALDIIEHARAARRDGHLHGPVRAEPAAAAPARSRACRSTRRWPPRATARS